MTKQGSRTGLKLKGVGMYVCHFFDSAFYKIINFVTCIIIILVIILLLYMMSALEKCPVCKLCSMLKRSGYSQVISCEECWGSQPALVVKTLAATWQSHPLIRLWRLKRFGSS